MEEFVAHLQSLLTKMTGDPIESNSVQPQTQQQEAEAEIPKITKKDKRYLSRKDTNSAIYASSYFVYQTASTVIQNLKSKGQESTKVAIEVSKRYMEQYPACRTFVYTTAVLSAIPITIFSLCFAVSFMVSLGTAMAGVFLVQGSVAFIGLSILIPVEIGIVCLAGGATLLLRGTGAYKLLEYPDLVWKINPCWTRSCF